MCEDDYKVEVVSTFELGYREGEREMSIDIDFRDPSPVLYASVITQWRYPYEAESISPASRQRIIERISHYLRDVRGFTFEVDLEN